ncbi:MAG TPA: hypothetical protein PKY51_00305 [Fimbriimonadaceae bacterium]|nr:hypothetical protein [Fimbriimonadaceae bacterium]
MTTAIILTMVLAQEGTKPPLVCPIMLSPVSAKVPTSEYNGALFGYCCAGCEIGFEANPTKVLGDKKLKGKTVGEFLFDPVDRREIEFKDAAGWFDYASIRFYFRSAENLATFKKDPKKFGTMPKLESLVCPVSGETIARYTEAAGYEDIGGVRYYLCCMGCEPKLVAEPAKYTTGKKGTAPKAIPTKKD